jgi:arylsulfatase A-like enzyme
VSSWAGSLFVVIDIAPTIYEIAGMTAPEMLNGVVQKPLDGMSAVYTFDRADAPGHRRTSRFWPIAASSATAGLPRACEVKILLH